MANKNGRTPRWVPEQRNEKRATEICYFGIAFVIFVSLFRSQGGGR